MVIGKIDWFGGINNKNQKVNNYGFIIPIENNNPEEGIYVHRDDVPKYLQELIEGSKGKGVYVQFDIDTERQRAINVELKTCIGIVDTVKRGRGYIKCEGYSDINFISNEVINLGDIVYFGIRQHYKYNDLNTINLQKIDNNTTDINIINKCINSNNYNIFKIFLDRYIYNLSNEELVKLITDKINNLNNYQKKELLRTFLKEVPNIIVSSLEFRNILSLYDLESYSSYINQYLDIVDSSLKQELLNEVLIKLEESNSSERKIYWSQIKYLQEKLRYKDFLWNLAPIEYQKQYIKNKYKVFFALVSQFNDSDYPYSEAITSSWHKLYNLDKTDKKLIREWNPTGDSFKEAQMISARGAEKLVIKYFKSLNFATEDISIHQITQESQYWRKADIRLNSKHLIDVKNTRNSVNSELYSEFCVPAFKIERGFDVIIVGVLSPYLQIKYMIGEETPRFSVESPKILGEFNKRKLENLENIFSDNFFSIDVSRDFDPKRYLPPWVFDYNKYFYIQQLEIAKKFRALQEEHIPDWEDISLVDDENPLPLFITARRKLPQKWLADFPKWQASFINVLTEIPVDYLSLPYLFLALLKHFLSMLAYKSNDFTPEVYKKILYPLKIYDPLHIIDSFIDTLNILWQHREKGRLSEFKIFKFNGRGLLQAKRSESEKLLTTILAYCGGWVEGKGKCGFSPLVMGLHKNCSRCGRLICPQDDCYYCSDKCFSYLEKKRNQKLYLEDDELEDLENDELEDLEDDELEDLEDDELEDLEDDELEDLEDDELEDLEDDDLEDLEDDELD
ncbi:hypothetical protein H6G76_04510 [Nostoc sp. FACHB-152]|uniref:hypothetical protein n=1 Tax=unclassified Nostoc TaxID=2593658 RepID=UPI001689A6AD|nr:MULTISPECIES: hypothetical protein [unclassified Nostoc]MBD2446433.1 hypothetical protein [Nostoc sp. FACHB-152]MBD2469612.1 hypothetical protein [Nostoc sp. FACHB-145]